MELFDLPEVMGDSDASSAFSEASAASCTSTAETAGSVVFSTDWRGALSFFLLDLPAFCPLAAGLPSFFFL